MRRTLLLLALLVGCRQQPPEVTVTPASADAPVDVDAWWSDGFAELNGYDFEQWHYDEVHEGHAVLVFVREEFSRTATVKASPRRPASDRYGVMKLNIVKNFQTGVYDYDLMTSLFAAWDPRDGRRAGAPVKLTMSTQDWCGIELEELTFGRSKITRTRNSYYDGESIAADHLDLPKDGVLVDELFMMVRGIPNPVLRPGEERRLSVLPSVEHARLQQSRLQWTTGTLRRGRERARTKVPAGTFATDTYRLSVSDDVEYVFQVESAFPHRIIEWRGPRGEHARLMGSKRMKYWQLNRRRDEPLRSTLGLAPVRQHNIGVNP